MKSTNDQALRDLLNSTAQARKNLNTILLRSKSARHQASQKTKRQNGCQELRRWLSTESRDI